MSVAISCGFLFRARTNGFCPFRLPHSGAMAMRAFTLLVPVSVSLCLVATSFAASKPPLKRLKQDSGVPSVDLFQAIEDGSVETSVIARSANEAILFVTNKSDAALSIQM